MTSWTTCQSVSCALPRRGKLVTLLAAACAAATALADPSPKGTASEGDRILTIALTQGANLSEVLSSAQVADICSGAFTNVVKTGNFALTNDLETVGSYAGDWSIKSGGFVVLQPEGLGTGSIRMTSTALSLLGGGAYKNDVVFTAKGGCSLTFKGGSMYGDVTCGGNLTLTSAAAFHDYGRLTLPGKTFVAAGVAAHHYHGAVTAAVVNGNWENATHHFYSPDNAVAKFSAFYQCYALSGENCATNALLGFGYTESNNMDYNFRGSFYVNANQTVDRVIWPSYADHTKPGSAGWGAKAGHACYFSNGARLTMRATADQLASTYFGGNGSVCWDPVEDYTLTLTNDRLHTLTGPFVVSNGTMVLTGATRFSKLNELQVAPGACVRLATEGVVACPALRVSQGGTVDVPEGHSVTVGVVRVAGCWMTNGVYAAEAWKTGGGTLVVTDTPTDIAFWAKPVDGNWSETAKWSPAELPSALKRTYLTAESADYTVLLDTAPLALGSVTVGNDPLHTTTLKAFQDNALMDGTRLDVGTGGRYLQTTGYVVMTNRTKASTTVSDGGLWRIEGGTNVYRCSNESYFTIKKGGRLEVAGGCFQVVNEYQNYNRCLLLAGGTIDVSGDGLLNFSAASGDSPNLGSGTTRVRGNGTLRIYKNITLNGSVANPARIEVSENGRLSVTEQLIMNDATSVDISSRSRANTFGNTLSLKGKAAPAEVTVREGAWAMSSCYQLVVGAMGASETTFPTGIVRIAGGYLHEGSAATWGGTPRTTTYDGTAIGLDYGSALAPKQDGVKLRPCYGEMDVTGAFTNRYALCTIGIGARATGVANVDGGEFIHLASSAAAVGMGGGSGVLTLRGGARASFTGDLYVGGMNTNVIRKYFAKMVEVGQATSEGRVTVADSTLTAANVVIGADGAGTLGVGPGGAVTARDLVLSNAVSSTLSFTLADGTVQAGAVTLSGKLKIAPGAKIVVDGSAWTGGKTRFALVRATGGVEGAFAPEDVTLISNGKELKLKTTENGIDAYFPRGGILIVR